MSEDKVILRVEASPLRRWMAIGALMLMGVLLVWVAMQGGTSALWTVVLILAGIGALGWALSLRSATDAAIELIPAGLRLGDGRMLVAVEDIARIDRGAFAFKPSNGFLVRLKTPAPRGWAPGVWWRFGTYLGIGGTLSPGEARAMADLLRGLVDNPKMDL